MSDDEVVVRALPDMLWDEGENRAVSFAFTQVETSVSRLSVLSYEQICAIFQLDVPGAPIARTGAIAAGTIRKIVREHPSARGVGVVADPVIDDPPLHDNPAHALVIGYANASCGQKKEFSKGLARAIIQSLEYRDTVGHLPSSEATRAREGNSQSEG